jgi:hypothetical protein
MQNHGNIMLPVTATYPECARHFGEGALLDIYWEADLIDGGTIDHECGGGACEWREEAEVIERMHIVELTVIGDGDDDDDNYNHDAISALPRAVRAELCAVAREICEASR